ncbi:uncharacterized protein LOC143200082 isoform X4 [Rhynchophorus ferrugineus]|uniref:uncharacterized protein LOC143200082 isoform X4 n=1 Tax=Rhynchophorus ferrugineus TaxID=354439 RepID=UPI003FCD8FAE
MIVYKKISVLLIISTILLTISYYDSGRKYPHQFFVINSVEDKLTLNVKQASIPASKFTKSFSNLTYNKTTISSSSYYSSVALKHKLTTVLSNKNMTDIVTSTSSYPHKSTLAQKQILTTEPSTKDMTDTVTSTSSYPHKSTLAQKQILITETSTKALDSNFTSQFTDMTDIVTSTSSYPHKSTLAQKQILTTEPSKKALDSNFTSQFTDMTDIVTSTSSYPHKSTLAQKQILTTEPSKKDMADIVTSTLSYPHKSTLAQKQILTTESSTKDMTDTVTSTSSYPHKSTLAQKLILTTEPSTKALDSNFTSRFTDVTDTVTSTSSYPHKSTLAQKQILTTKPSTKDMTDTVTSTSSYPHKSTLAQKQILTTKPSTKALDSNFTSRFTDMTDTVTSTSSYPHKSTLAQKQILTTKPSTKALDSNFTSRFTDMTDTVTSTSSYPHKSTLAQKQILTTKPSTKDGVNYLVNSNKCKIIDMGVFSPDALKYYKALSYKKCSEKPLLTKVIKEHNVARVVIDMKSPDASNITCCYSNVIRKKSKKSPDNTIEISDCKNFQHNVTITTTAIMVKCKHNSSSKMVYENVHTTYLIDDKVKKKMIKYNNTRPLSVLLIGIDSISRLNFARSLPKTLKYIEERKWISLKGYNKMDDNTFPNLMAILTGFNDSMVFKTCNPKAIGNLDKCPMVWYKYRDLGYVTAYAEDSASMSTFNYIKKGFVKPPTDYYFRPYIMATEKLKKVSVHRLYYCTGPENAGERILNLADEFANTFKDYPNFGFFWMNSFSHNNLNTPSMMDNRLRKFLIDLEDDHIYNNSLVIFLSDHGMRFGDIRRTPTGWQEERLPFIHFLFPPWFEEKYPKLLQNLRGNTNKLTTPYDLHMTLQHLLVLSGFNYTIKPSDACPQCMSLLEDIPQDRSCKEAGIVDHWCTCEGYIEHKFESNILKKINTYFMEKLGNIISSTAEGNKCVKYKIKSTSTRISERFVNKTGNHIVLSITTDPLAEFETTITYDGNLSVNSTLTIGDISRLDYYAPHSKCITDAYLKKYCYCK